MDFSNTQVDYTRIPSVQALQYKPVEPQYKVLHLKLGSACSLLFIILFLCVSLVFSELLGGAHIPLQIVFGLFSICALTCTLYWWKEDPIKGYALREHDLSYRSGLFFRKKVTQPIVRIQHVEVKQGPLERRYDLANLLIYSAGGSAHTFIIPGILKKDAEQFRDFIIQQREEQRDAK